MTDMATKPGKHMPRTQDYAKDPLTEGSDDKQKIKKARKEALHVKEQKKRQQKRTKSSGSGSIRKPFLRHGQFHQPPGDQPADFRSALGAIVWATLPDHVELGFCQLTDQTLDPYPNQDLCYSNNCSNLDVISVGSESVNVELQKNSSYINEFLSLPESATSRTKQSGVLTAPGVKDRLAENIQFWDKIGASGFILKVIREGYALPFKEVPEPADFSNDASARRNSDFVTSEISELLSSGRIREVSHKVYPLSVADNEDKLRLMDLRHINQFLRVPKIKFEDIRTVRDLH